MPVTITPCPDCRGTGRRVTGIDHKGKPVTGKTRCERCRSAGFVPIVDGKPGWPFGEHANRPELADPPLRTKPAPRRQGNLL